MKPRQRWALALVLAATLLLPLLPVFLPATPTLHVSRDAPPALAEGIARATGLEGRLTDPRRLAEKTIEAGGFALLDRGTFDGIAKAGPRVRFTPVLESTTVLLSPPECSIASFDDLAGTRCRPIVARGDGGRSAAALARAAGPEAEAPPRDEGEARSRALQSLSAFAGRVGGMGVADYEGILGELLEGDAVAVLPSEWASSLRAGVPGLVEAPLGAKPLVFEMGLVGAEARALDRAALADLAPPSSILPEDAERATAGPEELRAGEEAVRSLGSGTARATKPWYANRMLVYSSLLILLVAWGASLYWRVASTPLRFLLVLQAYFLVEWDLLRLMKLAAPAETEHVWWFLYYAPMLALPTTMLVLALEASDAPRRSIEAAAIAVSSIFLLLVLTTRATGLVLDIPEHFSSGDPYGYGPLHAVLFAWIMLLGLVAWGVLMRTAHAGRAWGVLAADLAILVGLVVWYVVGRTAPQTSGVEWIFTLILLVLVFCESLLLTGTVPTARSYRGVFAHLDMPAWIVDDSGRVLARTAGALAAGLRSGAPIGGGPRTRASASIPGGELVWTIDLAELDRLRRRLDRARVRLERSHASLARRADLGAMRAELDRRTRVLNTLDSIVGPVVDAVSGHGRALATASPTERARILRAVAVDLSFAKYVGALVLGSLPVEAGEGTEEWNRSADVVRALDRFTRSASSQTHMVVLLPLDGASEGRIRTRSAIAALSFVRALLSECARHDGAEALVRIGWSEGAASIAASFETVGRADPAALERLDRAFPCLRRVEEDGRHHFRGTFLDPDRGSSC